MKLMLHCNLEWNGSSPSPPRVVEELRAIGFTFKPREVPNGILVRCAGPAEVELNTVEELIELQKELGLPIQIEDGRLVVVE